jgi:hypothetical protein
MDVHCTGTAVPHEKSKRLPVAGSYAPLYPTQHGNPLSNAAWEPSIQRSMGTLYPTQHGNPLSNAAWEPSIQRKRRPRGQLPQHCISRPLPDNTQQKTNNTNLFFISNSH